MNNKTDPQLKIADAMNQFSTSTADLRDWAFAAGVRLADQNKPLLVNLAIEALLTIHTLSLWGRKRLCLCRPATRSGVGMFGAPVASYAPSWRTERRRNPRRRGNVSHVRCSPVAAMLARLSQLRRASLYRRAAELCNFVERGPQL
ncbi:hypothetical protein [Massilia glaciei]|uniref:hypothetical protein n=1 Tax=Massilia glaciei TaxID=1524097 RepID=UPI0011B284F6|nr:hypothetical protein [Massilia glaciei]